MKAKILSVVAGLFIAGAAFLPQQASGQGKYGATPEDSVQCVTNLSLYIEYVKQKAYADALPGWRKACEICPKSSKNLYLNGVKMFRSFIQENKANEEAKQAYIDTLMTVYDNRITHFGQEGFVKGRKAADMFRYRKDNPAAANALFKESMDLQKEKSEAGVISGYYQSLYAMYKKGEADKAALLEGYLPVNETISKAIMRSQKISDEAKRAKAVERYTKAKNNIDEMFVQIGSCEDIVGIFGKKIEANPEDLDLSKKTLSILSRRECTDNDLYGRVAKFVHEKEPSAESAYSIAIMDLNDRKYGSALDYFKQAIELSGPDNPDLENYYLGAAQASLKNGSAQSANSYARKALGQNPNSGKAYLIIAQAVAGSKCGTNEFEIKAVYWLAYDYAQKAKSVDSKVSSQASRLMSGFKKQWPSKEIMFQYSILDKESVTIGCWVAESTKVREP